MKCNFSTIPVAVFVALSITTHPTLPSTNGSPKLLHHSGNFRLIGFEQLLTDVFDSGLSICIISGHAAWRGGWLGVEIGVEGRILRWAEALYVVVVLRGSELHSVA